jgi:hypothetical protein
MPDLTAVVTTVTKDPGFFKTAIDITSILGIFAIVLFSLLVVCAVLFWLGKSYMAGEQEKWTAYIRGENEKWTARELHTSTVYKDMIAQVSSSRDKDMQLLSAALEDNRDQTDLMRAVIERQKTSDRNQTAIFDKLSKILEDRCRNHINCNTAKAKAS